MVARLCSFPKSLRWGMEKFSSNPWCLIRDGELRASSRCNSRCGQQKHTNASNWHLCKSAKLNYLIDSLQLIHRLCAAQEHPRLPHPRPGRRSVAAPSSRGTAGPGGGRRARTCVGLCCRRVPTVFKSKKNRKKKKKRVAFKAPRDESSSAERRAFLLTKAGDVLKATKPGASTGTRSQPH